MSSTPRVYITTAKKLQDFLAANGNKLVDSKAAVVGVHFQHDKESGGGNGKDSRLAAISIASSAAKDTATVLQVLGQDQLIIATALESLMKDPGTVKVFYGLERAARWFHQLGRAGVTFVNCVDLQVLCQSSSGSLRSISRIAKSLGSGSASRQMSKPLNKLKTKKIAGDWTSKPIAPPRLDILVQTAQLHAQCYHDFNATNGSVKAVSLTRNRSRHTVTPSSSAEERSILTSPPVTDVPTTLIASETDLQSLLTKNKTRLIPAGTTSVGVHFAFEAATLDSCSTSGVDGEAKLVVIAIASPSPTEPAVILQLEALNSASVIAGLRALLCDPNTMKIMHNVHQAAFWLHCYGLENVALVNCIDLQLLYENEVDQEMLDASVLKIATACFPEPSLTLAQSIHSFKEKIKTGNPTKQSQKFSQSAQLYAQCYGEFSFVTTTAEATSTMTNSRWQNAVANGGRHAIWFNAESRPRSLECLMSLEALPASGCVEPLELQCEFDPLMKLLPAEYQTAIQAIDNYHTKLVDICLDVGRIPYVYTGKKQRVVLNDTPVSKDTIDEIIRNLGGEMQIGDDNRAGIDRQLHRISVMRSKTDEVYGLTIRVGRALRNAACALTDLLLSDRHADKSVLVLGHPGSGKTTLIRDVARCISETMENVCIIDTSNEIGGDGLVPHECVGWARRMMVQSLEKQAGVMIECVQNHTVETLIVDEIGRRAEVLAASTVRQRGPRLIASAHGDFRALIKNPELKGLVGGSQQVLLGDALAAKSTTKSKLQTQRAGNPIFDVIVELDHVARGRCRIIWDVAKAVDDVLDGQGYSFETRHWDVDTRGVLVL